MRIEILRIFEKVGEFIKKAFQKPHEIRIRDSKSLLLTEEKNMAKAKRRDKSRVVLRTGESQRADGTYHYCWTDANRKRRYVYAKTLDELRYKEEQIEKDKKDGIKAEARYTTLTRINRKSFAFPLRFN